MRSMTKSPLAVTCEALTVGEHALEKYSSPYSRHDFTQAQLFAILVLRQFLRADYRGVVGFLKDCSDVREALGLRKVPHYSTLCYAEQRLLKKGLSSAWWAACWPVAGPSA